MRTCVAVLLLSLLSVSGQPPVNRPTGEVKEIAKLLAGGKDPAAKIAALRKRYADLDEVAVVFKPRRRGGIGFGPKANNDGIEIKLMMLVKKGLSDEELKKQKDDLLEMSHTLLAMAHILEAYKPAKAVRDKTPADWMRHVAAMDEAAEELIVAIKKGKPAEVKAAARAVNNACNECHTVHRD